MPKGVYPEFKDKAQTKPHPSAGLSKNKYDAKGNLRPERPSRSRLVPIKKKLGIDEDADIGDALRTNRGLAKFLRGIGDELLDEDDDDDLIETGGIIGERGIALLDKHNEQIHYVFNEPENKEMLKELFGDNLKETLDDTIESLGMVKMTDVFEDDIWGSYKYDPSTGEKRMRRSEKTGWRRWRYQHLGAKWSKDTPVSGVEVDKYMYNKKTEEYDTLIQTDETRAPKYENPRNKKYLSTKEIKEGYEDSALDLGTFMKSGHHDEQGEYDYDKELLTTKGLTRQRARRKDAGIGKITKKRIAEKEASAIALQGQSYEGDFKLGTERRQTDKQTKFHSAEDNKYYEDEPSYFAEGVDKKEQKTFWGNTPKENVEDGARDLMNDFFSMIGGSADSYTKKIEATVSVAPSKQIGLMAQQKVAVSAPAPPLPPPTEEGIVLPVSRTKKQKLQEAVDKHNAKKADEASRFKLPTGAELIKETLTHRTVKLKGGKIFKIKKNF